MLTSDLGYPFFGISARKNSKRLSVRLVECSKSYLCMESSSSPRYGSDYDQPEIAGFFYTGTDLILSRYVVM